MLGLDLSFRHDSWLARLPRSPRDAGTVRTCVRRPAPGERETPPSVRVEPDRGVVGDARERELDAPPGTEVSLINEHILRAVAGDETRMPLAGDNLIVDLELSEANLPVGTRLHVGGEAVLVVSDVPHRPCRQFVGRFGPLAAQRVARATRRGLRGRGVLCSVERAGEIRAGDAIRVERPAGGGAA